MKTIFSALLSISISVAAQFALKAGMAEFAIRSASNQAGAIRSLAMLLANRYVIGGFLLYGLGAVVWLSVLAKWDVSKAYPLVGFGFVLTALVGYLVGEAIAPLRFVGIVFISAGVLLVGKS